MSVSSLQRRYLSGCHPDTRMGWPSLFSETRKFYTFPESSNSVKNFLGIQTFWLPPPNWWVWNVWLVWLMLGTRVIPTTRSTPPVTIKTTFVVFVIWPSILLRVLSFWKNSVRRWILGLAGSNVRGKTYNPLPVPSWFPVIRKRNDEMSMKTFFAETKLFLQGENVEQTSCDLLVVPQPTKVSWYYTKRNSHAD